MAPLISQNIDRIISACKKHKLKHLYLFGSAARGDDFNDKSDVDFMYAFDKDQIELDDYADNYFDFLFGLEDMLDRKIDLVPEEKVKNPFFLKRVKTEKIKLYGDGSL